MEVKEREVCIETNKQARLIQTVFTDPLFVVILQAARGPPETKGLVPKLTKRVFKSFMYAEFQVTSTCSIHFLLIHTS